MNPSLSLLYVQCYSNTESGAKVRLRISAPRKSSELRNGNDARHFSARARACVYCSTAPKARGGECAKRRYCAWGILIQEACGGGATTWWQHEKTTWSENQLRRIMTEPLSTHSIIPTRYRQLYWGLACFKNTDTLLLQITRALPFPYLSFFLIYFFILSLFSICARIMSYVHAQTLP